MGMKKAVETMHNVFTDKTLTGMSPMERGVAAINYVIEDKGVEYLKPHIDVLNMPFFQIHGYDILIFFTYHCSCFNSIMEMPEMLLWAVLRIQESQTGLICLAIFFKL